MSELTRIELLRIADEYRSERDAAKRDAMRAFDERNILLQRNDDHVREIGRLEAALRTLLSRETTEPYLRSRLVQMLNEHRYHHYYGCAGNDDETKCTCFIGVLHSTLVRELGLTIDDCDMYVQRGEVANGSGSQDRTGADAHSTDHAAGSNPAPTPDADAERYRWCRKNWFRAIDLINACYHDDVGIVPVQWAIKVDAAIDQRKSS